MSWQNAGRPEMVMADWGAAGQMAGDKMGAGRYA